MDLLHQVDDDDVADRRHASAIETLSLHDDGGDRGSGCMPLKALCAALRCNTTLTSIDLQIEALDSDETAELVDAVEHNPRIISCKVSVGAFDEGSDVFAAAIDRIIKARFVALQ